MMNERITEDVVRKHFNHYSDKCTIEEQKSSIPKIDKLLKNASKKGNAKGYPEFIISLPKHPDFIIVVECKANIVKHQSATLDKYDEYAVDGALLYASFLSKGYDVLAIGVSGQDLKELKVSHYLCLKEVGKPVPIFGSKLLDIESYINGYLKSPEKFRQDYNALRDFSRELNEELHHHKIPESQRALLISSILIALDDKAFCKAYKEYEKPEELAKFLVDTISNVLRKANLLEKNLGNLKLQFNFIRSDTSLSAKQGVLRNLIDSIDEHINTFIKTHEYFDVLGQLYVEFLRYANSDKGLGIVLTPPHITELFAELVQVNKNSIIYDNCTGTGGFLISAMKKMIEDAKGDQQKIKEIKTNQLFGVEYQSHIFALTVSNMYIHQDGKTNIINGNCFDEEIMQAIKSKKPTVGFLNPPYKADKKKDIDELEFVLNNLEGLQPGGTCIAIVPMQCALAQKGKVYELKKQLLQKHTLEAVLSMPDELFFDSEIGVVTCVMIWTAHKPHSPNKETYFGYYKDDGFVKRKNKGRIDAFSKWEGIKAEWVSSYINRKTKPGFSVNKIVTSDDEWCAEAYMETDYSLLKEEDFIKNMKAFLSYKLNKNNENISIVNEPLLKQKTPMLNTNDWEYFRYDDGTNKSIFKIKKGKRLTKKDQSNGDIPYVSSSSLNNGVDNYIGNGFTDKNCISFACYGSIGEVFYQDEKVWISDNANVFYLRNRELNVYLGMFLATVLCLEQFRFSYGMTGKKERLQNFYIKLPVDKNGLPDFEFMENYIKSLPYSSSI